MIIEQPKDTPYGARRYGAEDLEGHRWFFAAPLTPARTAPKRRSRKRKMSKRKKSS